MDTPPSPHPEPMPAASHPPRRSPRWRLALSGLVVAALVGLLVATLYAPSPSAHAGVGAATGSGAPGAASPGSTPAGANAKLDVSTTTGSLVDTISQRLALHDRPGGRIIGAMAGHTQFGTQQVVAVTQTAPGWLGVISGSLHNNRIGWIPAAGARLTRVDYAIRVQTRSHRVTVFRSGRVVRTLLAAVGSSDTPTPVGRFVVTDRLMFRPTSAAYGCCALALSAHQYRLQADWTGQDLVAIHSTPETASIGKSLSHGCVRVSLPEGRWLVQTVPLGTLVTIRDT